MSKTIYIPTIVASLLFAGCGGSSGGGGGGTTGNGTPTPVPTLAPTPVSTPTPTPTETPVLQAIALNGTVTSFPDTSVVASSKVQRKSYVAGAYKASSLSGLIYFQKSESDREFSKPDLEDGSLGREDMVPASALVSLFLLSDVNFSAPIATVTTDAQGNYSVTAADVLDYLVANNLAAADANEATVMTAFRALGRLQVRAVIIKTNTDGTRDALAIQSIADPANVDDSGAPVPVVVDPIVHRVVKAIVDQIKDAIDSLRDLGVSDALVTQLTSSVIDSVADEITRVVAEADTSIIEIPEGQNIEDVISQQENEFALVVTADDVAQLEDVIDGTAADQGAAIAALEETVINADEEVSAEDSTLTSSLSSDQQGLLAGLQSALGETVTGEVDDAIEEATVAGNLDSILNLADGQTAEQALALQALEKARQLQSSLRRLFLSMGLAVVVDENSVGDGGVIAVNLPAPPHVSNNLLPGGRGFGDRNIRLFKIGSGNLDVGSDYTSDANATLGVPNSNGVPQAPLYFAPALTDVISRLLDGQSLEDFQLAVDAAFGRISNPSGTPSVADFDLIDRVRVYHDLARRIEESSLVSSGVINALVDNKDATLRIKRLASVIAQFFTWAREGINVTPEGFPIYTGRTAALEGGADVIDSSELVRALSISLAETPIAAAEQLTNKVSFYAQFADEAVQSAIQQANFDGGAQFDLTATLASIYPSDISGYRDLITGTEATAGTPGSPASPDYSRARDRVARGLTSAVPSTLFGRTLTSESEINIRSALFFLNFLLQGEYLIDPEEGFFAEVSVDTNTLFRPNFSNIKFMQSADSVTVATMVSELLDVTLIANGDFYDLASGSLRLGLNDLPELPEFKEQNIDDFEDDLGTRAAAVDVSCTVERFDGVDPDAGNNPLTLSVFAVNYNADTGAFVKGDVLTANVSSALVSGDGPVRRTYTVEDLPAEIQSGVFGRDYVLRFDIANYQNDLPELFFWVDGFNPELNICDTNFPLFIGQDKAFAAIPGLGLVSDQSRPNANGTSIVEGIDISNFEQPGAPIYLTDEEEVAGLGTLDFTFDSTSTGFAINAADVNVGFAPLYGEYVNGLLQVSLSQGSLDQLRGISSVLGSNIRSTLEAVIADDSVLDNDIVIGSDTSTFEYDLLYLMRDAGGKFWVLEVRFLDVFTASDEAGTQGFIDIGIASVNSLGIIGLPEAAFDDLPSGSGSGGNSGGDNTGLFFQNMLYGDWLVLDPPTNYAGPSLLEAEEVSFGGNEANYDVLETATDGIVIRYSAGHFEENIASVSDFDTVFGTPPDYSGVPVRVDAGRNGVTFVKISFNQNNLTWVMEPALENAASFTTNLAHNDLVAVFSDAAADPDSPVYLGRVLRDKPANDAFANFEIAFEWIRFADVVDQTPDGQQDPREVVCFIEDGAVTCPTNHPQLYFSSDPDNAVGTVFDLDFDGVPALFDPNDADPNVPGSVIGSGPGGFSEGLEISAFAKSDGASGVDDFFLVETFNVYPGDIQVVNITSDVFGVDSGSQTLFTCSPPSDNNGQFTDFSCASRDVAGGVTVASVFQNGGSVGFTLEVPDATMNTLPERIDFDYDIVFRAPTDLAGNPLSCGNDTCPARPSIDGSVSVLVPETVVVLDDLNITIGTDQPASLSGLSSLDVTREFIITADPIPDAVEYELNIFCAASQPDEPWLPEENISFFAPARDDSGRDIQARFLVNVPWIGGRSCDISFSARLENSAGESIGVSALTVEDVTTTGGGDVFSNNELDLMLNQHACLVTNADGERLPQVSDTCAEDDRLFSVTALTADPAGDTATLTLGSGVLDARADGGRLELTKGELVDGAVIAFNVDLFVQGDVTPPSCGVISTDDFSNTCVNGELDIVSADFFQVINNEIALNAALPIPLELRDPTGVVQNTIPLNNPGFYLLVEPSSGDLFMEIQIDSFVGADGQRQAISRFTLTAGVNEFEQGDNENTFDVTAPGFMFVNHDSGQPVDFDIRFVRPGEMRVAWFLPPPRASLLGDHDINNDAINDLSVTFAAGQWTFTFAGGDNGVSFLEVFRQAGSEAIEANANDEYEVVIDETEGQVELFGRLGSNDFRIFSEFDGAGQGFIETEIFFGGPGGGSPGDPDGCPDCPQSLANTFIASGTANLSEDSATGGLNFDNNGSMLAIFTVTATNVQVSLPAGIAGITLQTFDFTTQEMIEGTTLDFVRNGSFFFVNYVDDNGNSYEFHINDFGVDMQINVFTAMSGGPGDGPGNGPGEPPIDMGNPDIDGDSVMNDMDNCKVIANPQQEDADFDGLGDVCDLAVPDISGFYRVDVSHGSNSQDFDEFSGACVAAVDEALLVEMVTEGNQIFLEIVSEDSYEFVGVMLDTGAFSLFDPDADTFQTTAGTYNEQTGSFSFSFTDVEDSQDGTVICDVIADVNGASPTAVEEQFAFERGLAWFEANEGEQGIAEFEYGLIQTGSVEQIFVWDFMTQIPEWLDVSADALGADQYLTANGIVTVDDLFIVDGFVSVTDTAILRPTINGVANDVQTQHVDLEGFDIEGMAILNALDEAFENGFAEDLVFPIDAEAYVANIVSQSDAYYFWCDDDFAPATLNCQNVVSGGINGPDVLPATSLDEAINSDADLNTGTLVGTLWGGRGFDAGGEFSIDIHLVSNDGTATGNELRAVISKRNISGDQASITLDTVSVVTTNVGATAVIELTIPDAIAEMGHLDDEERIPFVFVENSIEGTPFVRQGRKEIAGTEFNGILFNAPARDIIRDNFNPIPSGTVPPSDLPPGDLPPGTEPPILPLTP